MSDGFSMLNRPWSDEEQARLDAVPPPPSQWTKGDLLTHIWNIPKGRWVAYLADAETGEALELAEWEAERDEEEAEAVPGEVLEQREFTAKKRMDAIPLTPAQTPLLTQFLPPDGNTLIWADGGAGKSLFSVAAAESLSTGEEVIPGCSPTAPPMRVLFLDYEDRPAINRRRLARLHPGELPNLFYHRPDFPLNTDAGLVEVLNLVSRLSIDYLVIDSVGWAVNGDLTDPATPIRYKDALKRIGLPSLSLFHVPKVSDLSAPYGSAFWKNAFVEGWSMERMEDEAGHVFVMKCHKETEGQPGRTLAFKVNWGGYDDEGEPVEDITLASLDPVGLASRSPGNPNITAQNKARSRQNEYREAVVVACPVLGKAYAKKDVGLAVANMARMRGKEPPHRNTLMETYRQLDMEGIIEVTRMTIMRLRDLDQHDEYEEPDLGL